jgi:hypothetical protein
LPSENFGADTKKFIPDANTGRKAEFRFANTQVVKPYGLLKIAVDLCVYLFIYYLLLRTADLKRLKLLSLCRDKPEICVLLNSGQGCRKQHLCIPPHKQISH